LDHFKPIFQIANFQVGYDFDQDFNQRFPSLKFIYDNLSEDISSLINNLDIPVLEYHPIEGFTEAYSDFYLNKVL